MQPCGLHATMLSGKRVLHANAHVGNFGLRRHVCPHAYHRAAAVVPSHAGLCLALAIYMCSAGNRAGYGYG